MTQQQDTYLLPESFRAFIAAAGAASGAVLCSQPFDTLRLRLQLSRELGMTHGDVVYRGIGDAAKQIIKTEGAAALWSGLGPGLAFQIVMNGTRLGIYPSMLEYSAELTGNHGFLPRLIAGAGAGALGAFLGMPFFVLKNRMQSISPKFRARESYQYKSVFDAARQIFAKNGISGFYGGTLACMARVGTGSAAQLATYGVVKRGVQRSLDVPDGVMLHAMSSAIAAVAVVMAMNPLDLVSSRLTQQSDKFYKGIFDCFVRSYQAEGIAGLYKGSTAAYARLAPHTIVTFVLFEKFRPLLGLSSS